MYEDFLDSGRQGLQHIPSWKTEFQTMLEKARSPQEIGEVIARAGDALGPALGDGTLRIPIDSVCSFDSASEALERMAANQHFGKIVRKP